MPRAAAGVEAVDTTNARRAGMRCPSTSGVPVWEAAAKGGSHGALNLFPARLPNAHRMRGINRTHAESSSSNRPISACGQGDGVASRFREAGTPANGGCLQHRILDRA